VSNNFRLSPIDCLRIALILSSCQCAEITDCVSCFLHTVRAVHRTILGAYLIVQSSFAVNDLLILSGGGTSNIMKWSGEFQAKFYFAIMFLACGVWFFSQFVLDVMTRVMAATASVIRCICASFAIRYCEQCLDSYSHSNPWTSCSGNVDPTACCPESAESTCDSCCSVVCCRKIRDRASHDT
jgi:hypothetical protein